MHGSGYNQDWKKFISENQDKWKNKEEALKALKNRASGVRSKGKWAAMFKGVKAKVSYGRWGTYMQWHEHLVRKAHAKVAKNPCKTVMKKAARALPYLGTALFLGHDLSAAETPKEKKNAILDNTPVWGTFKMGVEMLDLAVAGFSNDWDLDAMAEEYIDRELERAFIEAIVEDATRQWELRKGQSWGGCLEPARHFTRRV
ncbi:MAG: hypothetical protein CSA62_07145 [Planctomycetota bacterium]|nr:MAG: hypothetical protein CSA62_07145 [Planctomycetota bacterium]